MENKNFGPGISRLIISAKNKEKDIFITLQCYLTIVHVCFHVLLTVLMYSDQNRMTLEWKFIKSVYIFVKDDVYKCYTLLINTT